jgi:hypothetical protein
MSNRGICLVLAAALLAAQSGCVLVVQGTSQKVAFDSEPQGATFTVAGQTGTTPVTLELPKDNYQIAFKHSGYEDVTYELNRKVNYWFIGSILMGVIASTVDLATGAWKEFETTEIKVTLQPLPDTVQELPVTIASEPAGAEILIGGRSYGVTPKELKLSWGPDERDKEVELRLPGYHRKKPALQRSAKELKAALEALPVAVTLRVTSKPEGAEIRVDGRPVGRTPVSVEQVWKPGDLPRAVELALDGYRPEKREITPASKEVAVEFQELVEEIVLPLKIEPAGAKVAIDGVALPDGTKSIKLPWSLSKGKHTVTVTQPGYTTKTLEVKRAAAGVPLELRLAPALPGNP